MRTYCIVKLSKLKIFELNTLVQKETSGHVERKPPPSDSYTLVIAVAHFCLRYHDILLTC
jgi:hypothetical protein